MSKFFLKLFIFLLIFFQYNYSFSLENKILFKILNKSFTSIDYDERDKYLQFVGDNSNLSTDKKKKIAMFCTGGIRCEKASSYMLKKGFKNLFQLKGGILKYLEDMPKAKSSWKGECFVFDNRVSVRNELEKGSYKICHGCRYPISRKDRKSYKFEEGVTCPKCFEKLSKYYF